MFWGGNSLGDHLPPVKDGEVKTSAAHPPAGWLWEPSVGFSGSPRRIPPVARDADLDYVYLRWPLHLLHLILSPDPWGQLPDETIYTLVLVSGSVLLIHCLIQSTFVLLPLGQSLDITGQIHWSGPAIQLGIGWMHSPALGLGWGSDQWALWGQRWGQDHGLNQHIWPDWVWGWLTSQDQQNWDWVSHIATKMVTWRGI